MAFAKGFKEKTKAPVRPSPDAKPQVLYPCVPEEMNNWPNKMGAALLGMPGVKMPPVKAPTALQPLSGSFPKQHYVKKTPLGPKPFTHTPGLPKTAGALKRRAPKNLFTTFKNVEPSSTLPQKIQGPQMATTPLGPSMANQSTGGGIAGAYGSN